MSEIVGRKKNHPERWFVLPAVIIITILFVTPIVFTIVASFTNYRIGDKLTEAKFVGFSNYERLFNGKQSNFGYSVLISLLMTFVGTALELILGMISALAINRDFKLKRLVIACLIVPVAMTPSIASQMWKLMFNADFGIINYFLDGLFHTRVTWLNAQNAFLSCVIATVWQFTPQVTLMFYAGLCALPTDPYESAKLDGANTVQLFTQITFPLMKPLVILCTLLRTVDMIKTFDIPYTLTQGGPGSATKFLGLLIFDIAAGDTNYVGRACAIAVILLAIVCGISVILFRVLNKNRA